MAGLSPFKVYNTTTFGIDNTAMASFAALPDEQRWQVAFYVMALRFPADAANTGEAWLKGKTLPADLTSIATLATSSDDELSEKIKKSLPGAPVERNSRLSQARAFGEEIHRSAVDRAHPARRSRDDLQPRRQRESLSESDRGLPRRLRNGRAGACSPRMRLWDDLSRPSSRNFAIRSGRELPDEEIQKQRLEIETRLDRAAQNAGETNDFAGVLCVFQFGTDHFARRSRGGADPRRDHRDASKSWARRMRSVTSISAGSSRFSAGVRHLARRRRRCSRSAASIAKAWRDSSRFLPRRRCFMSATGCTRAAKPSAGRRLSRTESKMYFRARASLGFVGISFFAVYREAFEVVLFYQALWLQNEE